MTFSRGFTLTRHLRQCHQEGHVTGDVEMSENSDMIKIVDLNVPSYGLNEDVAGHEVQEYEIEVQI